MKRELNPKTLSKGLIHLAKVDKELHCLIKLNKDFQSTSIQNNQVPSLMVDFSLLPESLWPSMGGHRRGSVLQPSFHLTHMQHNTRTPAP